MSKINIVLEDGKKNKLEYAAYTDDGHLAGLLQIGLEDMEFTIEGLYVEPAFRRQGIATKLLDAFLEIMDDDITRPCTMTFTYGEGGMSLLGFMLNRNDFVVIDAGRSYKVNCSELIKSNPIDTAISKGFSSNVKALSEFDDNVLIQILSDLRKNDLGVVSSVNELKASYDLQLSSVCAENDRILCVVLVKRYVENEAIVDIIYANEKSMAVLETIAKTVKAIDEAGHDMNISVFTINGASENLADKLFEGMNVSKSYTYIANWLMVPNMDTIEIMESSGYFN